ncbi:serine hydrolase domain-containing protein [Bradyrhizobium quebecense]|uniref:Beta-lactamase family protein n=2 Tax=Bradyrhizobium quebecense TaxID=2748629 RepID=A0ACD3VGH2_9BRAD|nr:serine hydrolase domain-containing protein [Bradyrhizobium quebecense]UGY05479.1 beta-lactamase family protein [Bradyrhizobium quebecense]
MPLSRRTLLQGSLLSAAGIACRPSPALADPPAELPTSEQRKQMAGLAADFMKEYDVAGLSIAVSITGKPAYVEAFGVADRESGEALTPQHRFRIASISKPVTSTGIFTLVEAGKLRLGDYVFGTNSILGQDYPTTPTLQSLRPLGSSRSPVEQITIEHLLTHTTGTWGNQYRDPMFMNPDLKHRELINWTLEHMPLTSPPGESYAYSNFGYCILGRVIEKLSGRSYGQYIKDAVLKRCGITDMQIAGNTLRERASNEVKYYSQTGGDPYRMNVARMDSHGGWIATPSDLTTLFVHIDGFKDTEQLLTDDSLRVMSTPSTVNPRYAKGLFITANNNWWHSGLLDGTTTISVRTNGDFCWSAFTNTRSRDGMARALDLLVWHMVKTVPDWQPQKRA